MQTSNAPVDAKQHEAPGTSFHSFVGWTLLVVCGPLLILITIAATYGLALIGWIIAAAFYSTRVRRAQAQLRGSALRVGPTQFPAIHEMVRNFSERLGLGELPEVYVIEDNQQNAFALKQGSKKCVVLIDDIVYGALATGNAQALGFIVAHEIAHHALGHTGVFRRMIASRYLKLSRLDEFSCDAVAHALLGEPTAARDALLLLLVGPQLRPQVDTQALDEQAREVADDRHSKKSEGNLSHPLLLRRYARLIHGTPV